MNETESFERIWLTRFSTCLDQEVGEEVRKYVLAGSEHLDYDLSPEDVIQWTREAMERLERTVDEPRRRSVMTGCACRYPASELQEIRKVYEETEDLEVVHSLLQKKFESFLRDALELEEGLVEEIVDLGWGLAGVKNGKTITATKIPKSGNLRDYFEESDPDIRRKHYCHCPRVRDAVGAAEELSLTYCYCGAGFYKDLWEVILQKPVYVEVLESVLAGGDVCKIAIYLP